MKDGGASDRAERCSLCGAATGLDLGGRWICERCYEVRSSCCAEFEEEESEQNVGNAPNPRVTGGDLPG